MTPLPELVVDSVSKSFRERRSWRQRLSGKPVAWHKVLNDVHFTGHRGEVLGLLGANGAGKTTLLQILCGLVKPDSGAIRAAGNIAYCASGERSFYYRLTVRENLRFFATLAGVGRAAERDRRIADVLEMVDLSEKIDEPYSRLSSGMRQRLAIARSLVDDPPIILFDEPTRAVDPVHAHAVRTFIRDRLAQELGKTVLLATNYVEEAWDFCDRIIVLRAGHAHEVEREARPALGNSRALEIFVELSTGRSA